MNGDNPNVQSEGPVPFSTASGPDTCSGGPGADTVVNCEQAADGSEPGGPPAPPLPEP